MADMKRGLYSLSLPRPRHGAKKMCPTPINWGILAPLGGGTSRGRGNSRKIAIHVLVIL